MAATTACWCRRLTSKGGCNVLFSTKTENTNDVMLVEQFVAFADFFDKLLISMVKMRQFVCIIQ